MLRALLLLMLATASAEAQEAPALGSRPIATFTLGARVPGLAQDTTFPMLDAINIEYDAERTMRLTAWRILAFSGMGSNMRKGEYRDGTKTLIRWLRAVQDAEGKFISQQENAERQRQDHLLATVAMVRTCLDANYKLLKKSAMRSTDVVLELYERDDIHVSDVEVALLGVLAKALDRSYWLGDYDERVLNLAKRCGEALQNKTRRSDAVRHFIATLSGKDIPNDLTLAMCWPGDLARDPLHTWVAAFVLGQMSKEVRRQHWPQVEKLISARGDNGMWPAADGMDADTVTAILTSAIGMLYVDVAQPKPRR